MIMAKRKQDRGVVDQLDMFGSCAVAVTCSKAEGSQLAKSANVTPTPPPANDVVLEAELIAHIIDEPIGTPKTFNVAANDAFEKPRDIVASLENISAKLPVHQTGTSHIWLQDEWWTTAMVCAYLKLGRKAIWERQRDPRYQFPKAFHFGSMRQRWKSGEVRAWAEACLREN